MRATWVRMMLVELTRMASHLLFQATNGMDIGARVDDDVRLARARGDAPTARDDHRAADEPQLHPPRRHRRRPPRRLGGRDAATCDLVEKGVRDYDDLLRREPDLARAARRRGHHHHRAGARARRHAARSSARPASRGTCARRSRTSRTTTSTSTSIYTENGDCYDRFMIRLDEILESIKIVRQCVERMPPGDYRVQDRKVTPPPRARIDESMEALIHHFKLFTEGFQRARRARRTSRSSRRAARSAATWCPTARGSRCACTSAARPSTTSRRWRRWPRARSSPTRWRSSRASTR